MAEANAYLLAGQASELERLQLQSRVWEPAGEADPSDLASMAVFLALLYWLMPAHNRHSSNVHAFLPKKVIQHYGCDFPLLRASASVLDIS